MEDVLNSGNARESKVLWSRGILNGFIALILGVALYMIPALVVAIRMALDLGPKLKDTAVVSSQISMTIAEIYGSNLYLAAAFVVVLAALVFWRSRVISRIPANKSIITGTIVGAIPAIVVILPLLLGKGGLSNIVAVFVFIIAGIAGGAGRSTTGTNQSRNPPQHS
jgi:hypothetical protein